MHARPFLLVFCGKQTVADALSLNTATEEPVKIDPTRHNKGLLSDVRPPLNQTNLQGNSDARGKNFKSFLTERGILDNPCKIVCQPFQAMETEAVTTKDPKDTIFKPILSRMEAQKAATDKSAKAILNQEKSAKDAKTLRLRAARIARDENP